MLFLFKHKRDAASVSDIFQRHKITDIVLHGRDVSIHVHPDSQPDEPVPSVIEETDAATWTRMCKDHTISYVVVKKIRPSTRGFDCATSHIVAIEPDFERIRSVLETKVM